MTNWRKILSWQFNEYTELKRILDEKGYDYQDLGNELIINHREYIWLDSLTTLPDNIQFNNGGNIYLDSLTSLPDNIQFNNRGNVWLESLTSLPNNIQFNNKGDINLPSLISLPDNIQFNNRGNVWLSKLQFLPENKYEIFHNEGIVYYDWDGDKYKEFNPHERNASLKFSWKLSKEEIKVGDRVRVIASEELLKALHIDEDYKGKEGRVDSIDLNKFVLQSEKKYAGYVCVIFAPHIYLSFPYPNWQDFLEILE